MRYKVDQSGLLNPDSDTEAAHNSRE
jgi:hypothetical protein